MDEELLKLLDLVCEQIKKDVAVDDMTAIEEMLTISVDKKTLNYYLPEEQWLKLKECENPTVCRECGSTDVEFRAWIHCNTGNISGETGDKGDTWCNACDGHHGIENKKEYDKNVEGE